MRLDESLRRQAKGDKQTKPPKIIVAERNGVLIENVAESAGRIENFERQALPSLDTQKVLS
jgi:hypothetical protein